MRLLYMSVHEILEYDELKIFADLGHQCFSLGAYTQPGGENHRKRPSLDLPHEPHFIELAMQFDRRYLHPEQLEGFDTVMIMHEPEFISKKDDAGNETGNWPLLKKFIDGGGRVIWRSIGQSTPRLERFLKPFREQGLEIVRYSPTEATIMDYAGQDAMIRFYKDPAEYIGWNGTDETLINFTQSMRQRGNFCGLDVFTKLAHALPSARVYGPGNEDMGDLNGGLLTFEQQIETLQNSRVYFYHGTYPASYTLSFIEAMMTGIPMACVGPRLGNSEMFPDQKTYEIPSFITDGVNGFVDDDIEQLQKKIGSMLDDQELAEQISAAGRARAIELFGKEKIKSEWAKYLGRA